MQFIVSYFNCLNELKSCIVSCDRLETSGNCLRFYLSNDIVDAFYLENIVCVTLYR